MGFNLDLPLIRRAQTLLAAYLPVSRMQHAPSLSQGQAEAYLKLEADLPTGSFKPRGALYALAVNLARSPISEVTASSTGNHGAAVAYAAKTLGVPATIFLPANPNPVKREKILALGARIIETGSADLAEAYRHAHEYSCRTGVYFLNDATDANLPAGPGTIGLEIADQLPAVANVYVPMGDTALIRGLAAGLKQLRPDARVIGVQAERAPSYYLSWKQGKVIGTETCDTCADGLATRTPDAENVRAIRELVNEIVLLSEQQMVEAIRHLYDHEGVLAEPAGAAATAAFLAYPAPGPAVMIVSGANVTEEIKARAGIV